MFAHQVGICTVTGGTWRQFSCLPKCVTWKDPVFRNMENTDVLHFRESLSVSCHLFRKGTTKRRVAACYQPLKPKCTNWLTSPSSRLIYNLVGSCCSLWHGGTEGNAPLVAESAASILCCLWPNRGGKGHEGLRACLSVSPIGHPALFRCMVFAGCISLLPGMLNEIFIWIKLFCSFAHDSNPPSGLINILGKGLWVRVAPVPYFLPCGIFQHHPGPSPTSELKHLLLAPPGYWKYWRLTTFNKVLFSVVTPG